MPTKMSRQTVRTRSVIFSNFKRSSRIGPAGMANSIFQELRPFENGQSVVARR